MAGGAASLIGYLDLGVGGEAGESVDWPTLLDALGAHSPTVEADPPHGCWLALRLGGRRPRAPDQRGDALLETARTLGYSTGRVGLGPTPGVARLAARWGVIRRGIVHSSHRQ